MFPLKSTEIYDDVTFRWKSGPELPVGITHGVLVEDQMGGVVLIGGYSDTIPYLDTLYHLSNAGKLKFRRRRGRQHEFLSKLCTFFKGYLEMWRW